MLPRSSPSHRAAVPGDGTLPPLGNLGVQPPGGISVQSIPGWQDPTRKTIPVPSLPDYRFPPFGNWQGPGLPGTSGCPNLCANCGVGLPGMSSSLTMCVECIRCYIAQGLKLIGVDILLVMLLLLGIYILFQRQANTVVTQAGRTAGKAAEAAGVGAGAAAVAA